MTPLNTNGMTAEQELVELRKFHASVASDTARATFHNDKAKVAKLFALTNKVDERIQQLVEQIATTEKKQAKRKAESTQQAQAEFAAQIEALRRSCPDLYNF